MRVYIVRHGESENNKLELWTGWMDVLLTEKGIEDAKKAGELLRGISFDKVYSSDLVRAKGTAKNAIPGCDIEESHLLREINIGNLAGKPLDTVGDEERKLIAQSGYKPFDGETVGEFGERIRCFMKKLEELDAENVAVFAHAGWLRTFFDIVVGSHLPRKNVVCDNCAIGIFEFNEETWKMHSWINL